jgi:2-keto-3-deoxy-L-rhamnonate aldolase RhmA
MARLAAGGRIPAAWAELGGAEVAEIVLRPGWSTIVIDGEHGAGGLLTAIKKERRQRPLPANPVRRKKPRRNEQ